MKKLTIKRSEWYRGQGGVNSSLLKNNGEKCCLGFYLLNVRKATKEQILNIKCPSFCNIFCPELVDEETIIIGNKVDNVIGSKLMSVNDSQMISEEERELELKELFKKIEIDVKFV